MPDRAAKKRRLFGGGSGRKRKAARKSIKVLKKNGKERVVDAPSRRPVKLPLKRPKLDHGSGSIGWHAKLDEGHRSRGGVDEQLANAEGLCLYIFGE